MLCRGNLKVQWDKQGKHIEGHRNFIPGDNPSRLVHPNPQRLIDDLAGSGLKYRGDIPGAAGYQEIVNFKEFIGYDVNPRTGQAIPTNWGKIHYAQDGVHIVPTAPRG